MGNRTPDYRRQPDLHWLNYWGLAALLLAFASLPLSYHRHPAIGFSLAAFAAVLALTGVRHARMRGQVGDELPLMGALLALVAMVMPFRTVPRAMTPSLPIASHVQPDAGQPLARAVVAPPAVEAVHVQQPVEAPVHLVEAVRSESSAPASHAKPATREHSTPTSDLTHSIQALP